MKRQKWGGLDSQVKLRTNKVYRSGIVSLETESENTGTLDAKKSKVTVMPIARAYERSVNLKVKNGRAVIVVDKTGGK